MFSYFIKTILYNYVNYVKFRKRSIIKKGWVTVVGLTATPRRAEKEFKGMVRNITVDLKNIKQYEIHNIIEYQNINHIIDNIPENEKGIIYHQRITEMINIWNYAKSKDIKSISIWSINSGEHAMTDEQKAVRQYIIDEEKILPQYDMLIINKSSETGINIVGQVDYIIVHHSDEDVIKQVRGRFRGDLSKLYIYRQGGTVVVPDEFLGVRLFKEDTDRLCERLNIRNKNGRLFKWTTVKNILPNNGYIITELPRENNRASRIIEKALPIL